MAELINTANNVTKERESKRRQFILNANLWKVILRISVPLILVNALTFFYQIVDSMLAAQISKTSISAVTVITQISSMITSLGTGFASGGLIIIARLIGRNDYLQARKVANTLITLAVWIAVITCSIVVPLAVPIMRMLRTPEATISAGKGYFMIQIVTACVTLFNNIYLGFEKARGQTVVILLLNVAVMTLKILLSFVFVYAVRADITMIALATLTASLCLTAYIIIRLAQRNYLFRYSYRNKDMSRKFLSPIVALSLPIFLGRFVFSLGKVVINAMCGNYGDDVVGALGVSNNMGGYVTNVVGSVEESAGQIISTNLGNRNQKRALTAFAYSAILNVGIALTGVVLLTVFNNAIVNFYADGDAEFARTISNIFFYEKMGIVALGINSSVLALLYGFGFTKMSMVINLARLFVFRIPSLWILQQFTDLGSKSVGIAMMVSNIGIGLMSIVIGTVTIARIKKHNITDRLRVVSADKALEMLTANTASDETPAADGADGTSAADAPNAEADEMNQDTETINEQTN